MPPYLLNSTGQFSPNLLDTLRTLYNTPDAREALVSFVYKPLMLV